MRRGHKKKRKASVLCLKGSEARDCISGKSGGSRGRKFVLGALTILSHVGGHHRHDRGDRRRAASMVTSLAL
jgi:hypothetical protein